MKLRIISLIASLAILFLLIYFSNASEIVSILSKANFVYVFLGIAISFLLMGLRTFRWKVLLKRLDINMSLKSLFPVFMSSLFISNITPAKSGDPVRSYFLKKKTGITFSKTIPSVVIERMLDVIVLIVMSVIGLAFVPLGWEMRGILGIVVFFYVVLIAALIWFGSKKERVNRFFKLIQKFFGWLPKIKNLGRKTEDMALDFKKSFVKYKDLGDISLNIIMSMIVWVVEGVIVYIAFLSIGVPVDMLLCIFIMAVSVLVGVASSLPGGLGSSEVVMVLLFTSVLSLNFSIATGGVLLARLLSYWLTLIVGAFSFKI